MARHPALPPPRPLPAPALRPLAALWAVAARWRNGLYDAGRRRSFAFDFPVIGVGNLRVGGTGKTPAVAWMAERLGRRHRVGIVSRGYGRRTRGYRTVPPGATPAEAGDEPVLLARRLPEAAVAVGERRVEAIPALLLERPELGVVLLDDAFQHRAVRPGLQVLCTAWDALYADDACLPAGRLREPASGAARADLVLVTRCPDPLPDGARAALRAHLGLREGQELYCAGLAYGTPWRLDGEPAPYPAAAGAVAVLSGIAEPAAFQRFARERHPSARLETLAFPDHHRWRRADLDRVRAALAGEGHVLTTEKDAVRLAALDPAWRAGLACWVQPVAMAFADPAEGERLAARLEAYVAGASREAP